MRAAALSSRIQDSESFLQDGYTPTSYRGASEGQSEQALAAELADVINRETLARPQASQESFEPCRTSLDDMAYGQGFVWLSESYADVEDELLGPIRPDTRAWLEKAKRQRQRTRARRALYWLLVLAVGVGTLANLREPGSLQSLGYEVAQLLGTEPLW